MQQKDYDFLALHLNEMEPGEYNDFFQWKLIVEALADDFVKEDSLFDEKRFLEKAGL